MQVAHQRPLVERVFAEYQLVKRLHIRHDTTVPPELLVALDIELQHIEQKDFEHREKMRKAKQLQPKRR